MLNFAKIVSPATLAHPKFKTVDGVNVKLDHFEMTDNGLVPVYVETDEVDDTEAFDIIFGGAE